MFVKKKLFFLPLFSFMYLFGFSQNVDSLKTTSIFPNDGPVPFDNSGFSFTDSYVASNSFWASPYSETDVYHALLKYDHPTNPDYSYELRLGKGGQVYSFLTSAGETVPPQYPASAPWVDEVWQMVAVDGALNMPGAGMPYFIHQAGVYLRTPEQTQPFYSPIVAEYYNPDDNSYTVVNWGLQAHTSGHLLSGYTSSLLYYTRYTNLGNGVIQVDLLMYNFGDDTMTFINVPWGGVRRSTYDHWFASLPDHSYIEQTGNFTSYSEQLSDTGGWAAFSSDAMGNAPSLGLLMDNDEGVLRLGDAGSIANRDYTVFEGIKFPGTDLTPGKAIRARNFFILDSSIDNIKSTIINENLDNETHYGPWNKISTEVDSIAYGFEYQAGVLVPIETDFASGLNLKLRPFQNSFPLFIIKSTSGAYRVTTDLYTYSPLPYDGQLESVKLLGYLDKSTSVEIETHLICSGENYTFPDGSIVNNITAAISHFSDVGLASNGFDSLVYTILDVDITGHFVSADDTFDGPGGVGSSHGESALALWLDAGRLLGDTALPTNGTAVNSWNDLSGNQDHYESLAPNQPMFNAGGFSSVQFDASAANPQFLTGVDSKSHSYGSVFFALNPIDGGTENPLLGNTDFILKYEQTSDSGFLGYSEVGGTDYVSTLPCVFGADNLVSFHADCAGNQLEIYSNGTTSILSVGSNSQGIPLGELGSVTSRISGDFYEVIAYRSPINNTQKILVDNYLSAKYGGLSIQNNLYDEDEMVNGDFDFHVAGIGRLNSNDSHLKSKGTGLLTVDQPTQLDDGEFLIWGENNMSAAFAEMVDVPASLVARSEKIWKFSEVNTALSLADVGVVDLTFDLSDIAISDLSRIVLLIDSDDDGSFADEVPIPNDGFQQMDYEGQADLYFHGVDLQDGLRICLGQLPIPGPGGVFENLALWLSADKDISSDLSSQVNLWRDQAPGSRLATGQGPVLQESGSKLLNYNPVLTFDGIDDKFDISGGVAGTGSYSDVNIFIVTRLNADPHQSTIFREGMSGGSISSHLPWSNEMVFWDAGLSSGDGRLFVSSGLTAGSDALWGLTSHDGTTDLQTIRKNGRALISDNTAVSITGNNSTTSIASSGGGLFYNGDIAEVVVYLGNQELASPELHKIESYLAVKYAYTLDNTLGGMNGDYVNSRGDLIWDADENPTYHNDVIGIARDDAATFEQKQSIDRTGLISIYSGNLEANNNLNVSNISVDASSVIIGHDQGRLYDPASGSNVERPAGIPARLEREWKITNHQFIDDYSLVIEWDEAGSFDINDIRLLVDTDGDFSDAMVFGPPDVNITAGSFIISGINPSIIPLNSTRYITIGSVSDLSTPLLPVQLLSFSAKAEYPEVVLDWTTETEVNNDFFTVEKSEDARSWQEVAVVKGAGNSENRIEYHSRDKNPFMGQSYYRLKQTDFDGTVSISNVVPVYLKNRSDVKIAPSPNTGVFEVITSFEGTFQMLDMRGVLVHEGRLDGSGSTKVEVAHLPKGMYMIQIFDDQKQVGTDKVMIR